MHLRLVAPQTDMFETDAPETDELRLMHVRHLESGAPETDVPRLMS